MDPQDSPAAALLGQSVHARPERDDSAPAPGADELLAARLATAPGLVRAGASCWDHARTPIHALSMESAYADPQLLRDLGARGARFAPDIGVEVVVGAETAGVPLAASISLTAELPFAFVRKPGYRGHEIDEPPVRGADVAGRRVLLVDDAISTGTSVERFTASLVGVGAEVVGVFVLVDMRDVADTVSPVAAALRDRFGEHVSAGARSRHGQRPARSCPPQAHRRRDREPMDRRRSALGSPARNGRRSLDSPVTGGLPVCRCEPARGHGDFSRMTLLNVNAMRHYHEVGLLPPAALRPHCRFPDRPTATPPPHPGPPPSGLGHPETRGGVGILTSVTAPAHLSQACVLVSWSARVWQLVRAHSAGPPCPAGDPLSQIPRSAISTRVHSDHGSAQHRLRCVASCRVVAVAVSPRRSERASSDRRGQGCRPGSVRARRADAAIRLLR